MFHWDEGKLKAVKSSEYSRNLSYSTKQTIPKRRLISSAKQTVLFYKIVITHLHNKINSHSIKPLKCPKCRVSSINFTSVEEHQNCIDINFPLLWFPTYIYIYKILRDHSSLLLDVRISFLYTQVLFMIYRFLYAAVAISYFIYQFLSLINFYLLHSR